MTEKRSSKPIGKPDRPATAKPKAAVTPPPAEKPAKSGRVDTKASNRPAKASLVKRAVAKLRGVVKKVSTRMAPPLPAPEPDLELIKTPAALVRKAVAPIAAAAPAVGSSKPAVHATEQAPSTFVDRGLPLPPAYGYDRLVALVRDPAYVFCYWELQGEKLPGLVRRRGSSFVDACAWVLRMHRLDEGIACDIEIDPGTGNWYINVGSPGRYQFELGLLSPDGEWISLAVSQIVRTPLSRLSDRIDEEWRLRPEDEKALEQLLKNIVGGDLAPSSQRGSGMMGAERLRSSFALASSMLLLGASASGRPVAGSWAWSYLGASGKTVSSSGSGGFGWVVAPTGAHEPVLERPTALNGGPNWNAQPGLPHGMFGKTQQPHFQVKLPRVLKGLKPPRPTWPPPRGSHPLPVPARGEAQPKGRAARRPAPELEQPKAQTARTPAPEPVQPEAQTARTPAPEPAETKAVPASKAPKGKVAKPRAPRKPSVRKPKAR